MKNAQSSSRKSPLSNQILNFLFRTGVLGSLRHMHRNSLTVLNYHRVEDASKPGFDTYKPNVSATPEMFAAQMAYVKRHYNVITCDHLAAWLQQKTRLPPYPALITFDDGYKDNLVHAYPILRQHGLSAIIFLATAYIGGSMPFYWDYVAHCFYHTQRDSIQLTPFQSVSWCDDRSRDKAISKWVEFVKHLPDEERQEKVRGLAAQFNLSIPDHAFAGLCLTWDQVREMHGNGLEFGAHTVNHPILTRVPLSSAATELADSKSRVEAEIGKPVISFAYPNGQTQDFSAAVVGLVRKAGFHLAFTLVPGPSRVAAVRENPLTIRRIFLARSDTLPRFAAKLVGGEHVTSMLRKSYL